MKLHFFSLKVWINIQKSINVIYHINKSSSWSSQQMQKKHLTKPNTLSWLKKNTQTRKRWKLPQSDEEYEKLTTNINTYHTQGKAFSLVSGTKPGCLLLPLLFDIVLKVLARAIKQEKDIKMIRKGEVDYINLQMTQSCILKILWNSYTHTHTHTQTYYKKQV